VKGISLLQPWAWAIFYAGQDVENRSWPCPRNIIGQRVAIHASKGMDAHQYSDACVSLQAINPKANPPPFPAVIRGAIIGTVEIVGCVEQSPSRWFCGPYGFVLRDPVPLAEPIPCKGALGFWDVPPEIERKIHDTKA